MSQTLAVWALVIIALFAANLPFVSQRLLAVFSLTRPKTPWLRLFELVIFYLIAGGIGLVLGKLCPSGGSFTRSLQRCL